MKKPFILKNVIKKILIVFAVSNSFYFFGDTLKAQPVLTYTKLIQNLSSPVDIKNAGDGSGRLFIVEQTGAIRIYKNGILESQPFLNLNTITSHGSEQGLLSIAFHPKYKKNRQFFVYYTDLSGAVTLARYKTSKTNPDSAIANSGVKLLSLPKPGGYTNHNGGNLHFGVDGYLYATIGDGGSGGDPFANAQNGLVLFGKMLRLNINAKVSPYYTIPLDNPFVGNPAYKPEIYALGLRNSWRWSFDRLTGDTWIGDVGQDKWEEVDFSPAAQAAGANYGWRCYEGGHEYNTSNCGLSTNYVSPIFDYKHNSTTGGYSITGGYVYRGTAFPSLQGYYICSDYVSANSWKIKPNGLGAWDVYMQSGVPASIVSYGEDENGELYASSLNGKIYTVGTAPTPILPSSSSTIVADVISTTNNKIKIYPTLVDNHKITIELKEAYTTFKIFDLSGHLMFTRSIKGESGDLVVYLPGLAVGMYIVKVSGNKTAMQKIYITK